MVGPRHFLGSRARARREAQLSRDDAGFALLEVIIAFSVLLLALTGIGAEIGTQFSSVSSSRNEQKGQAVLARLLDEARALPYTVVAKGLSSADTTATSTATYIKKIGPGTSVWILRDQALGSGHGTGEVVNHYSPPSGLTPPPPFYEHKSCFSETGSPATCTGSHVFTALTFPTKYESKVVTGVEKTWLNHVIRVTVLVSWQGAHSNGSPTTLTGQTLIFSKTVACTSHAQADPNPASCQPNFLTTARAGGGVIAVEPAPGAPAAITGLAFTSFDLVLPGVSSNEELTQTSTVLGTAKASGGTTAPTSSLDQGSLVMTKATNNLATGTSDYESKALQQSADAVTKASSTAVYSITATPSPTDTGTSASTTSATITHECSDLTGAFVTTALPCGSGNVAQGTRATLTATLGSVGAVTLARVDPTATHPDRVLTERFAEAGAPTCPTTSINGCANSSARGALGTVELAGLPSSATLPATWQGYLVKLSGFRATATAWARSASTWLKGTISGVSGTLSYYNGSGYSTLTIGSSGAPLPSTAVTTTAGTATVQITPHLAVGGAACRTTTTSSHPGVAHVEQCSVSPLSGTITYVVTTGSTTIADFTMTVGLGTVSATANYEVAT